MYAVLAGGVGAARFLRGLIRVVPQAEVVAIVNVGDDLTRFGLRVCPDLDTITYHLAGVVDVDQQWGRADERHTVAEELARFGHDDWFTLGDRDLAVHLHRATRLAEGATLSRVTAEVADAFGVEIRLLPATDDPVETRIHTVDGRDLHFQEYWVRERAVPDVASAVLDGAADAEPAPGVVEALLDADAVLVAPSNPVVSIGTILAVPGIRAAVRQAPVPVVGVSPIVGGAVIRGMADRLLPTVGAEVSAIGVARHYGARSHGGLLDGWVVDQQDANDVEAIRELGLAAVATDTMMDDVEVAARLAQTCIDVAAAMPDGTAPVG